MLVLHSSTKRERRDISECTTLLRLVREWFRSDLLTLRVISGSVHLEKGEAEPTGNERPVVAEQVDARAAVVRRDARVRPPEHRRRVAAQIDEREPEAARDEPQQATEQQTSDSRVSRPELGVDHASRPCASEA